MTRKRSRSRTTSPEEFLESPLFRLGTRLFLGLTVVVIFLTLVQCTVKKPESPEWTTNLTVPLINRTYEMSELVWRMDQDGVQMDEDSNIIYTITQEIDTVTLDQDNLSISDIDTSISQQIGLTDVDPPSIAPVTVSFEEIAGLVAGVVPPMDFTVDSDMPVISTFTTVDIASGSIYIVVTNNLGIDLDAVTIELNDIANPASPVLIASETFPSGITDDEIDSILMVLDGKTISNTLRSSSFCHTPGGMVLSTSGKEIITAMHFDGSLSVSGATNAEVQAKTIADTIQVQLGEPGDTDEIHLAILAGGNVQLTIMNNTGIDATLTITFPDLLSGVEPLVIQQAVNAQSSQSVNVDISAYELLPADPAPQQLYIIVSVSTVAGRADINQTQDFTVEAVVSSVTFDSVTGIFSSTSATIDPTQEEIDIPEGFDGFELATAILTLRIENATQLPGSLSVQLDGDNGETLIVTGLITAGTADSAVTTIIVHDSAASFLSPEPSLVDITGNVVFGGGGSTCTITTNDYLYATLEIVAPLEMIITETTIETDVESEDIDVEDIDIITEHVERVSFIYNVLNSLPVGITANIYISQSSDISAANNDLDISGICVPAGPHDVNGLSTGTTSNLDTVLLTNDDIQVLNTDSVYILTEFVLEDSGGEVVRLTHDNSITITGRVEVEYHFDGSF